jgi:hypothetical protein
MDILNIAYKKINFILWSIKMKKFKAILVYIFRLYKKMIQKKLYIYIDRTPCKSNNITQEKVILLD